MKKTLTIILLILVLSTGIAFADSVVTKVPNFDVHLNGTEIDNIHSTYPLLVYNDITYFPMTWDYGTGLGLNLQWSFEDGLIIDKDNEGQKITLEQNSYNVPGVEHIANLVTGRVVINGEEIDNAKEEFPLLIYRDITYFPLTWRFAVDAFGWDYHWSESEGLEISTAFYDGTKYPIDYMAYIDRVEEQVNIWNEDLLVNGRVYEFSDGQKKYYLLDENNDGIIRYEWPEGDLFIGEVRNDKFTGPGMLLYNDGGKYIGDFYKNHFTGFGKLDYKVDILGEAGYYLDDELISDSNTWKESQVFKQEGIQPMVFVITEFSDIKKTTSDEEWLEIFNQTNDFYKTSSEGKLSFELIEESQGDNNGIVTVTLDQDHPRFGTEIGIDNIDIALKSIELALESFDLESYDTNHNGVIETYELHIVNVIAGYEEIDGIPYDHSVFAHQQLLSGYAAAFEDFQVGGYFQVGELHYNEQLDNQTNVASYGVVAHELGHSLGLPDLYDIDYTSEGIGPYSLMSHGMNLYDETTKFASAPSDLDPWCKEKLGFIEPTVVSEDGTYELSNQVLKIQSGSDYYLIENRLSDGLDFGLADYGEGVLVWKIQPDVIDEHAWENNVNTDEKNKGVDLIEANEDSLGFSQLDVSDPGVYHHYFTTVDYKLLETEAFEMTVIEDGKNAKVEIKLTK